MSFPDIHIMKGDHSMPKQDKPFNRNYSRFDALSTEALREILYQDSLLPDDEESDMDAILYIMEVIAKREALEPTEKHLSTEEAWQLFNEHYRSDDCDGTSLYEDPEEAEPRAEVIPCSATENTRMRRSLRGILRVACIAAVLIVILLAGSITAYAMGFDVWGAMAQWTQDVFGLAAPGEDSIYPEDDDPRKTLEEYGITESVLPNWIPEGYEYSGIEVSDTPMRKMLDITYSNGHNEIWLTIAVLTDSSMRTYEKDAENATIYIANGIEHYIATNLDVTNIVWATSTCECAISGNFSLEVAQQMITSIYGS